MQASSGSKHNECYKTKIETKRECSNRLCSGRGKGCDWAVKGAKETSMAVSRLGSCSYWIKKLCSAHTYRQFPTNYSPSCPKLGEFCSAEAHFWKKKNCKQKKQKTMRSSNLITECVFGVDAPTSFSALGAQKASKITCSAETVDEFFVPVCILFFVRYCPPFAGIANFLSNYVP